jgi:adenylylsulfate kinase
MVVWITGRPASGKSTLARALVAEISARGVRATVVDSDEVRAVVTPRPRYTPEEREIVYRGLAYLAARLAREGIVAVVAATAHEASLRAEARRICEEQVGTPLSQNDEGDTPPAWLLVHARCPLVVCEARDPKGLYRRARANPHNTLPGLGVPYEEPADADVTVDTGRPLDPAVLCKLADRVVPTARSRPSARRGPVSSEG